MANELHRLANVDRVIHEPARLLITALLYEVESADFVYLLRETGLTRGNLSAHLSRLEEAGYIKIEKGYRGKVPQTTCSLTEAGRAAFRGYREQMKRAIDSMGD